MAEFRLLISLKKGGGKGIPIVLCVVLKKLLIMFCFLVFWLIFLVLYDGDVKLGEDTKFFR